MLKRVEENRVAKWAIAYLAGAWVALQVFDFLWELFGLPIVLLRILVALLAVGLVAVVSMAMARPRAPRSGIEPHHWRWHRQGLTIVSILLTGALLVGVGYSVDRTLDRQWARGEAILEARALADGGDLASALSVAERALELLPENADLLEILDDVSVVPVLETDPPQVSVYVADYAGETIDWQSLGETPLTEVRLPRGYKRWRLEKEGFATVEAAGGAEGPMPDRTISLLADTEVPEGMVPVPGGRTSAFITGLDPIAGIELDPFFIDRYEVTNEEFYAFVFSRGYENLEYWPSFERDGEPVAFDEAMLWLRDSTDYPGPAGWSSGRYPEGEEKLPVTGVSWYEAAAYASFVGRDLPTIRHWVAAAGANSGPDLVPLSHFGDGVMPVGTSEGISRWGAYDMAGNVREWLFNSAGPGKRHNLGGAFSDPSYFFTFANTQSPWDRLPTNGFRLAVYPGGADYDGVSWRDEPLLSRDYYSETPVSDEVFEAYRDTVFAYEQSALDARIEAEIDGPYGPIQHVSFAGTDWGRVEALLLLPGDVPPPWQTAVIFVGSTAINDSRLEPGEVSGLPVDLLRSGRALVIPILRGTFQRRDGLESTWPNQTTTYADYVKSWVVEFRRTIDYLESRPEEFDATKLAYLGFSWGARMGAIIPAVEPRLDLSILSSGGLASGQALPQVDQINYVTRVTIPTLMLNGAYDSIEPVDEAQIPMYELLGTPDEDKKRVEYADAGHALPRIPATREMLAWLDRYFGDVRR